MFLLIANWSQAQNEVEQIFNFIKCDEEKETYTYHLKVVCQEKEVILQSVLLRHKGTAQEYKSKRFFFFQITEDGYYKITKGKNFWKDFSKKVVYEIDSLDKIENGRQHRMLMLSKKDSLTQLINSIPGLEKKRDNFWAELKKKKGELKSVAEDYKKAQLSYENGDLEPSKWSKIETEYLGLKDETNFIKKALKDMTKNVSQKKQDILRLKNETGIYEESYYHQSTTKDNDN